MVDFGNRNFNC